MNQHVKLGHAVRTHASRRTVPCYAAACTKNRADSLKAAPCALLTLTKSAALPPQA